MRERCVASDDGGSLTNFTRRQLLNGAAVAAVGPPDSDADVPNLGSPPEHSDPAVLLWQKWTKAHQTTALLGNRQQRLEAELINTIGSPRARLLVPGESEPRIVSSLDEIAHVLGSPDDFQLLGTTARAELLRHQICWDAAADHIGYFVAMAAEVDAMDQERQLGEALWAAPAQTLPGVAAKLHATFGGWRGQRYEFPWSPIQSALADLVQIGALTQLFGNERHARYTDASQKGKRS